MILDDRVALALGRAILARLIAETQRDDAVRQLAEEKAKTPARRSPRRKT